MRFRVGSNIKVTRDRNKILIRKLDRQKKVALPNCSVFYAEHKRVKISLLPDNVKIKIKYRIRGWRVKRQQRGKMKIANLLKKGFNLAKHTGKSTIGRGLAKMSKTQNTGK